MDPHIPGVARDAGMVVATHAAPIDLILRLDALVVARAPAS